jgi:hypothetical protein
VWPSKLENQTARAMGEESMNPSNDLQCRRARAKETHLSFSQVVRQEQAQPLWRGESEIKAVANNDHPLLGRDVNVLSLVTHGVEVVLSPGRLIMALPPNQLRQASVTD